MSAYLKQQSVYTVQEDNLSSKEFLQWRRNVPRRSFSRYLQRHLQASLLSLGQLLRAPISSLMILMVIGIALALPSGLLVLLQNLQQISQGWDKTAQISLYLKSGIDDSQAQTLVAQLQRNPDIKSVRYISPQQGLTEFQQTSGLSKTIAAIENNPLPAVIEVTPSPQLHDTNTINQLLNSIQQLPQVDMTQLDMAWIKRLYAIIDLARHIAYVLAILLGLGILFIIGNTIHLATQKHKEEIEVYKLVGATDAFVRRPFLYSGLFYGLAGGILAWLLIEIALWWLRGTTTTLVKLYDSHFHIYGLNFHQIIFLIVSAAILGLLGSWLAVSRHLREF